MTKPPFRLPVAFLNSKLLPKRNPDEVKYIVHVLIWLNPTAINTVPKMVIGIRVFYINHLWCTRFCIKCFMCFISFNPQNIPTGRETVISILQTKEIGLHKSNDFSRVTEAILLNLIMDPAQSDSRPSILQQCFTQS